MSFSWIIGIGSATRITPATQQAAPTTWPRRVEGTMSPYLENIPREKMENIKHSNDWGGDLIRQPVTSVGHRINLCFWQHLNLPDTTWARDPQNYGDSCIGPPLQDFNGEKNRKRGCLGSDVYMTPVLHTARISNIGTVWWWTQKNLPTIVYHD